MVKEAVEAEYSSRFFWLDQFFMVFYIVELVLRAALYQGQFLWGSLQDIWGNWLDLVVVSSGVLDMYLLPLCGRLAPATRDARRRFGSAQVGLDDRFHSPFDSARWIP